MRYTENNNSPTYKTMTTIKQVRKELGLTNEKISKMFNYSSKKSYQNSSKRQVIDAAIITIFELTKKN